MITPAAEIMYKPSIWVREIETQDGVALLDIRQGLCLGLNPLGTEIWRALKTGITASEIAARLGSQCEGADNRIFDDLRHYLNELERKGLITDGVPAGVSGSHTRRIKLAKGSLACGLTNRKRGPHFLVAKCLFAFATFDFMGSSTDFAVMLDFVREWPNSTEPDPSVTVDVILAAINFASIWYPKRVLCLQRSAATTCLLRSHGIRAEMVLGAQRIPFKAHAWTEVEGMPVNERRDVRATYSVWDRC